MRILITGSNGMVGRNVVERLAPENFEILAPSSAELNLFDYEKVLTFINFYRPSIIIHCAGKVGGVQANMKDLYGFFYENMSMGMNLVTAAKKAGIRKFLNLSSACVYPRNAENPLKESSILSGELEPTNEGYALAKIAVAKMCGYITNEIAHFNYKTLIPCNLYGRGDKFSPENSHMIPALIDKLYYAKSNGVNSVEIWGDGTARREFMFAGDLADCIVQAVKNFDSLPNIMNVGLGYDYTINEYYKLISKIVGYTGVFTHDLTKPVGMKRKLLDITKQKEWGWEAKTPLKEGIEETYKFFKSMRRT